MNQLLNRRPLHRVLGEQAADKVYEFFRVAVILYGWQRIIQDGGYQSRSKLKVEREAKCAHLICHDSDGPNILLLDVWLRELGIKLLSLAGIKNFRG